MTTNIFITDNQPSGTSLNGTYDFRAGNFQLPSGLTTPAPDAAGQILFIPGSGVIAIASGVGGDWITFTVS